MKYEFQIRMQHRHLKAIVGALRFRHRLLAGDVYGTIGRRIWQRKRCHRDRMAAPGASAAIGTGGGGPWRKRCHQDKRWHRD